jgi:hypothetical protein
MVLQNLNHEWLLCKNGFSKTLATSNSERSEYINDQFLSRYSSFTRHYLAVTNLIHVGFDNKTRARR